MSDNDGLKSSSDELKSSNSGQKDSGEENGDNQEDSSSLGQNLSRRTYLRIGGVTTLAAVGTQATINEAAAATSEPFGGSPWAIPGRIEAENFDTGGDGVSYHDEGNGNDGGAYRQTDVDIEAVDDDTGEYNVGWINDGEWLAYTVDVTEPDSTYAIQFRVAGKNGSASVDVSLGGEQVGTVDVPDTGGWQDWTTVKLTDISLPASGEQTLRLDFNGDKFNINWINFDATGTDKQPFGGSAWPIPGRIEAEDFDTGGEDISYHDTSSGNKGGAYRDTAVDIEPVDDDTGEYNVGWINDSEWLEYTVDVTDPDTAYDVQFRVAGKNSSTSVDVSLGGESLGTVDVPDTGGWQDWTTVKLTDISLPASGEQTLRLDFNGDGCNLNWVDFVGGDNQQPFGGAAWPVPGRIEAEDFDTGGEGVSYHDTTDSNESGSYRDTAVDIEPVDDDTGGYNVGWIKDGEWLEYTVDVTDPDSTYDIQFRMAGKNSSASADVSLGGELLGTVDIPDTGGWQDWTTVKLTDISLPASGEQVLRLDFNGSDFNLNWVDLISSSTSTNESPVVDSLGLSEVETDNSDAEFDASWSVSDAESNLDSIDLTLTNTDTNDVADSTSTSVSGGSASDTTRLVASGKDGSSDTYEITCVVADGSGNTDSATATLTESEPVTNADTEKWGVYEVTFSGPFDSNPYQNVDLSATFTHDSTGEKRDVLGFWDGSDVYRIRFMPDLTGDWSWQTTSDASSLNGLTGTFTAGSPSNGIHGPVEVDSSSGLHFVHADGSRFEPFGTTSYGWAQVEEEKRQKTLDALDTYGKYDGISPFNKVRMSATPHWATSDLDDSNDNYRDKRNETVYSDNSQKDQVNPDWFQLVDQSIEDLLSRGIQAELIPFHLYAHISPGDYTSKEAEKLTEYMVARFGAYRNVWWCLSNEWNHTDWSVSQWNKIGRLVRSAEFYPHLASNHDWPCQGFDWGADWVTHIATQRPIDQCSDTSSLRSLRSDYSKPLINDEYRYEGYKGRAYEASAEDVVVAHWRTVLAGGYGTHGEGHDQEFFRGGGQMHATSTERIAFLRDILMSSSSSQRHEPIPGNLHGAQKGEGYYLYYYGRDTPTAKSYDMPSGNTYSVDVIDTWNMTIDNRGEYSGSFTVDLPGNPYFAVRMKKV